MSNKNTRIPVECRKNGVFFKSFDSIDAAAKYFQVHPQAVHQVVGRFQLNGKPRRCMGYSFHYVEDSRLARHDIDGAASELLDSPIVIQDFDIHGLANLFEALNEPCFCEQFQNYKSIVATKVIKIYRACRARGMQRGQSASEAHKVGGLECCHKDRPLHRGWRSFFDYNEACKILRNGHPVSNNKNLIERIRQV